MNSVSSILKRALNSFAGDVDAGLVVDVNHADVAAAQDFLDHLVLAEAQVQVHGSEDQPRGDGEPQTGGDARATEG